MNGNGSAHAAAAAGKAADDEERENIFLFWPNIIGSSLSLSPVKLMMTGNNRLALSVPC